MTNLLLIIFLFAQSAWGACVDNGAYQGKVKVLKIKPATCFCKSKGKNIWAKMKSKRYCLIDILPLEGRRPKKTTVGATYPDLCAITPGETLIMDYQQACDDVADTTPRREFAKSCASREPDPHSCPNDSEKYRFAFRVEPPNN